MDFRLFDIVALVKPLDELPRGAQGTIVDEFDNGVTVEFLNARGETLALLDLPTNDVSLVERLPIRA
jgi:hypothetical protein